MIKRLAKEYSAATIWNAREKSHTLLPLKLSKVPPLAGADEESAISNSVWCFGSAECTML